MPRDEFCPRFAIHAGFDARQWSSSTVMTFATAGAVVLDDFGSYVFPDTLSFLNAHSRTLAYSLISTGIDDQDRFYLFRSSAGFTLTATADSAVCGFPAGVTPATSTTGPHGAGWYIFATSDWARGFQTFTAAVDTSVEINILQGSWDSLALAARHVDASDVDAPEVDGLGVKITALARIWCGINDDGHVFICSDTGASETVTWNDTDFRERLGFSGDEAFVNDGYTDLMTADNPCPGCLHPTRPADVIDPTAQTYSSRVIRTDGTNESNWTATHHMWRISAYLDGPADTVDLHRHWHYACLPYLYPGAPCAIYQDWGDTRLYTWRGDYSDTFTAEVVGPSTADPGYRGRIQGCMDAGTESYGTAWPQHLRRRSPLAFTVRETAYAGQYPGA